MRLKEESDNWRASAIRARDFRHDAGLPETEIPRNGKNKRKPKHVHDYQRVELRKEIVRRWSSTEQRYLPVEVPKYHYTCKGCGSKKSYYSANWGRDGWYY